MINMIDVIEKKKQGQILSEEEIGNFIEGVSEGTIPDYQTSALLMAIYFKGLNKDETFALTDAMLRSGDSMDLSRLPGVKVDKHSTGGVGDKTSLIVAPLAAACGVTVAKMSGRGLGFSGGTVDKLESIPGFRVQLSEEEFLEVVQKTGMSIIGQTGEVAPADKKLYALRDVTATVDNISLISASIMSKKLASGSDAIVLDVKCGSGAFMKTQAEAEALASLMVEIGNNAGKNTVALVTDMNQPLGNAVGNTLEVMEACETLKGKGPKDIEELALTLSGYMIYVAGKADSPAQGRMMAQKAMSDGSAFARFKDFIEAQGGDSSFLVDYSLLKQPKFQAYFLAKEDGYLREIAADIIGLASQHLGAGRKTKEDTIDFSAGILLSKKMGDRVKKGDILVTLFSDDEEKLKEGIAQVEQAFTISFDKPPLLKLIKNILEKSN
ncbi:MAG: pyrimidine-nucleoside phosphorylase [Clostridia bacterium]|nr:pyrimidine-nucleoside phosphorylase [Clostridia bacterium]